MTITYQKNVANTSFMGFAKLLVKWKGSIYKLVFKELLMYGAAFAIISISYRNYMTEEQRGIFEKVALYCNHTAGLIPLSFVLGFYVTFVVTRWWNQFINLPWPDRVMHAVILYVGGTDERGRVLRRTMMRYVNLATVILFQSISGSVKKRFPTTKHIVDAGLMTPEEKQMFESITLAVNKHWVPLVWFLNLVNVAVKEGRIQPGAPVKHLLEEINNLRTKTGHLWGHDWVTVPLVYTQVVTLSTHLFFITCLLGRQFLDPLKGYKGHDIDLYFPFFTFLQFFFFLGWLKVAEQLINPFGEDDDDFETNWIIDRNLQVCYAAVDEMYGKVAKLEKDTYWGAQHFDIPYTEASLVHKIPTYKGSTMNIVVPPKEQAMVFPIHEEYRTERCEFFNSFLSRYCWCCPLPCIPPLNKPLGESYGRTSVNYDSFEKNGKGLGSNASIFGDAYFNLLNRGNRRDSLSSRGRRDSLRSCQDYTLINMPDGAVSHPLVNHSYNRRHRPSVAAPQMLSSVSETEQEGSEEADDINSNKNAPLSVLDTAAVKAALTFLDEDTEEDEEVAKE